MKNILVFSLITIGLLSACENNNEGLMPNISGKAYEVLVIMEDETWDQAPGKTMKAYLGEDIYGLPQSEPLFNLVQIPSKAFSNIFKTHRNIIRCTINDDERKNTITIKTNRYAKSQILIEIKAQNHEAFVDLLEANASQVIDRLNRQENERIIRNYRNYEAIDLGQKLREKHALSLVLPRGYTYDTNEENFAWLSHETPKTSQGILIYHYPYTDTATFEKEALIRTRNEFLRKYVPGPIENTYMTTEKNLPVSYREFLKDDQYFTELRGLWALEGPDFMGGPFVSYSTVDTHRNRVITIEGYVFAPQSDKRNYLRQLEAIISSFRIVPTEESDSTQHSNS